MSLGWEDIPIDDSPSPHALCDCCDQTTKTHHSDVSSNNAWHGGYEFQRTLSESGTEYIVQTTNRSEEAPHDERRISAATFSLRTGGFHLAGASDPPKDFCTIRLDSSDALDIPFAKDVFAMLDAIDQKNDRHTEALQ